MEYGRCRDMNRTFILIMLSGTFFSAVSQILLKQSANIKYENRIREYLNFRVILSYTIYMLILLLNTWCYTKVDMRYGPVIDTAAYVFVLLLSHFILKEKITKGKIMPQLQDLFICFNIFYRFLYCLVHTPFPSNTDTILLELVSVMFSARVPESAELPL